MTEQEIIKEIFEFYKDEKNFLVQLRGYLKFDVASYQEAVDLFKKYTSIKKGDPLVSTRVCLLLYETLNCLDGVIWQLPYKRSNPLYATLMEARSVFIGLIKDLFELP
jgi:hypothetical protein